MKFIQTRGSGNKKDVSFSQAILSPSASFGGLYVPEKLPTFEDGFFEQNLSYKELALKILKKFDVDIDDEILGCVISLYDNFDDANDPVPLKQIKDNLFINELYHGPTRAFKDMALSPFGSLVSKLAVQKNEKFLVLAATSGDTGPATLNSFANKENVKVVCMYPKGGTSDVQKLQMTTQEGDNLKVIGVNGNFDDTQNALKHLIASDEFQNLLDKKNIKLSAANSVNFGRIIFQTTYHVNAYLKLVKSNQIKDGEKIYIIIPSGNFGNALAAFYAKEMGLPVEKILITSNENNILTDLIKTGIYDLNNKKFVQTKSPAMDILKSSNIERILYHKFGAKRTKELMTDLETKGVYKLNDEELKALQNDFDAYYSNDDFGKSIIKKYFDYGYVLDPHTATAFKAYKEIKGVSNKIVICSTAEWTKFAPTMLNAIKEDDEIYSDEDAIKEILELSPNSEVPVQVKELFGKKELHTEVIDKEEIQNSILDFIKGD
ncbi:MAG: Threonine synthase (EC [uncultured Campylobacterales bacterium]|uniref:Threonine synthase n=1 Tax=uncultured Campylobacterales bacterium TaxID=352960 RepID=A0A6S6TCS1_9BACT|nr:MAG: Threonine synthase (EC [uncultured Campylobacterales bacterium]